MDKEVCSSLNNHSRQYNVHTYKYRYQDYSKLEIPEIFKQTRAEDFSSNTIVVSPIVDAKARKEKENIYKEFERYDEKYSKYKSETNRGETNDENICTSYKKVH